MIVVKNNFKRCYSHIFVSNFRAHSKLLQITNSYIKLHRKIAVPTSCIGVWRKKKKV